MNKLFLTMALAFCTIIASAQYSALTTISETSDSTWSVTEKLGVGYQVNEKLMVGITMDGEDKYELLGRYALINGVWGTCVYNYDADSEGELMDNIELGLGYSFKVWNNLHVDPNYTIPAKADENDEREGTFNLSVSYKF
jgi:opacity protein-like surface antigen